jgi:hypothetical protein
VSGVRRDAICHECLEELAEKKRVAAGRRMTCLRESRINLFTHTVADDFGSGVGCERPW